MRCSYATCVRCAGRGDGGCCLCMFDTCPNANATALPLPALCCRLWVLPGWLRLPCLCRCGPVGVLWAGGCFERRGGRVFRGMHACMHVSASMALSTCSEQHISCGRASVRRYCAALLDRAPRPALPTPSGPTTTAHTCWCAEGLPSCSSEHPWCGALRVGAVCCAGITSGSLLWLPSS